MFNVEKKVDSRVIRTKKALKNALQGLMKEKSFEDITVKDITTQAEVNRGTFYVHYKDKHDLMDEFKIEIMQGMSQIAERKLNPTSEDKKGNKESQAITIFEYLNKNKVMMRALLGPNGDLNFQMKLRDFLWKTLVEDSERGLSEIESSFVPPEYVASYIAFAHIGVIQHWLENGSKESPREMAQILSYINMKGPFAAMGLQSKDF